jgi:hypothetical protein
MHVHQAPTELPVNAPEIFLSDVVGCLVALQVLNDRGLMVKSYYGEIPEFDII